MKRPIISGVTGRKRGFSLAEVVIALGVITVGIVGVLSVFPTSLQTGHSAQNETRAAHIAQSVFGSLVAQAPSQFNNVRFLLSDGVTLFPAGTSPAIDLTAIPQSYALYAGNDGQLINSASNATYAITIYTNNSVAGFTDPASANAVTVRVAWPANAPAANQTFRDYVRIVSKY
jgi:prepilin-type N-terminal cleavage/methylation domain-containing protein